MRRLFSHIRMATLLFACALNVFSASFAHAADSAVTPDYLQHQFKAANDVLYYDRCANGGSSGSASNAISTAGLGDGGGCGAKESGNADNMKQVQDYFVKQFESAGYSKEEALKATAGIMGNWQQESGFSADRHNQPNPGSGCLDQSGKAVPGGLPELGGKGLGIAQWCGTRQVKLKNYTDQKGKDLSCLGAQLEFAWSEMQADGVITKMKGKSARDAAGIYMTDFEGASINGDREGKAEAIYAQIKDGGTATPAGGASASGTTSSSTSSGNGSSSCSNTATAVDDGECQNPFRDLKDTVPSRIDGGYDYGNASSGAPGSGPVYAACPAKIISVTTTGSGWPGLGTGGSGAYIKYQMTSGKAKGLFMYIAEDCTPSVKAGDTVGTSTPICQFKNQGTALETGWASGGGGTGYVEWSDYPGAPNNWASNSGVDVDQFLQSLGAPHDSIGSGPSKKGTPPGWPKWTSAAVNA